MNISLEQRDAINATLHLTLAEEDYKPRVSKKSRELASTITVKGFRKGKVPPALVQKMYGRDLLAEVLNDMVAENVDSYINENKIAILGNPLPASNNSETVEEGKTFTFAFDLGLVPQFELPATGASLEVYRPTPGDKEVNDYISNMQRRFGTPQKPETVGEEDNLNGDLAQAERQFITRTNLPLASMNPEVRTAFLGKAVGDTITFELEKAFDHQTLHRVTGQHHHHDGDEFSGEWTFTISEIARMAPADLDQDFFGKVFRDEVFEDEAAFRARVTALLSEAYDNDYQYYVEYALRNHYLTAANFDLPEDFLKRWLATQNQKMTQEQIDSEFGRYAKELRWTIIRNKVGEQLNLNIQHEDVLEYTKDLVRREFAQMGLANMDEEEVEHFANTHLQQEKGKNYRTMFERTYYGKVLDYLKANNTLNVKELPTAEFADKVAALDA